MSEKFASGTINPTQTNKQKNIESKRIKAITHFISISLILSYMHVRWSVYNVDKAIMWAFILVVYILVSASYFERYESNGRLEYDNRTITQLNAS